MIELFTPKRISPDCPFKGTQTQKDLDFDSAACILTLRCDALAVGSTPQSLTLRCDAHHGVWLRGEKHTAESDSAVGCTPRSFLKNLVTLTPRWVANRRAWLRGGIHSAELEKTAGRKSHDTHPLRYILPFKAYLSVKAFTFFTVRDHSAGLF